MPQCKDKTIFEDAQSFADACAEADPLGLNNGAGCCPAAPDPCNNFAADPQYIGAGVGGEGGTEGGDPSGGTEGGEAAAGTEGGDAAMGTEGQGNDASGQMGAEGAEEGNEEGKEGKKKEKKGKKSKKPPKSFRL